MFPEAVNVIGEPIGAIRNFEQLRAGQTLSVIVQFGDIDLDCIH